MFDPMRMVLFLNPAFHPKLLTFQQHRGIDRVSYFVFINIVGLANLSVSLSFVFMNIVGLTFIFCFPFFRATRGKKSVNDLYTIR